MEIIIKSKDGRELKFHKAAGFGSELSDSLLMDRLIMNQNIIQERLDNPNTLLGFLNKLTREKKEQPANENAW